MYARTYICIHIRMWRIETLTYGTFDSLICGTCGWHMARWCVGHVTSWYVRHIAKGTWGRAQHDSSIPVTWLVGMRDVTHSYVCYDSFMWTPCATLMCEPLNELMRETHSKRGMRSCTTWLVYMCDLTRLCVWHENMKHIANEAWGLPRRDSCICVIWLVCVCDMKMWNTSQTRHEVFPDVTHVYVWYDSFLRVTWKRETHSKQGMRSSTTWLMYMCDMTRLCVWHENVKHIAIEAWGLALRDSFICVIWLVRVCDMKMWNL